MTRKPNVVACTTEIQKASHKARVRGRSLAKKIGHQLLIRAQFGRCPICEEKIVDFDDVNVDHVFNIQTVRHEMDDWDPNPGNILLVHTKCNQDKGNRAPTENEILYLAIVNDVLQFDEATGIYKISEYAIKMAKRRCGHLIEKIKRIPEGDSRAEMENNMIMREMYTREIESLQQLVADYNEVIANHDFDNEL